jgi:ribosomal protein L24E
MIASNKIAVHKCAFCGSFVDNETGLKRTAVCNISNPIIVWMTCDKCSKMVKETYLIKGSEKDD